MITDWAPVPEPPVSPAFLFPCYASDIQILNPGRGIVMVTPDGANLWRIFLDFDGSVSKEFVNPFGGVPATFPLPMAGPFPVFGAVQKDLLLLSPSAGILFVGGGAGLVPRTYFRMRLDLDGTPGSESANSAFWMRIPENNVPLALDADGNWIFTSDIIMALPGTGIVMPMRGTNSTRRIRIDFDGALISE